MNVPPFVQLSVFNVSVLCVLFQQQEQDPTNLYIANLPPFMTENELEEMLQPYGNVISTRILRDPGMNSRGVGFARYIFQHPLSLPMICLLES